MSRVLNLKEANPSPTKKQTNPGKKMLYVPQMLYPCILVLDIFLFSENESSNVLHHWVILVSDGTIQ